MEHPNGKKVAADSRSLRLSHAEIATIQHALGVAELVYQDLHGEAIKYSNVRNNFANRQDQALSAYHFHILACTFGDLNHEINNSERDV